MNWDHELPVPRFLLSDYELNALPYAISNPLHYVTGVPQDGCGTDRVCVMCGNAIRLVLQAAEPQLRRAVIRRMADMMGLTPIDLDPPVASE